MNNSTIPYLNYVDNNFVSPINSETFIEHNRLEGEISNETFEALVLSNSGLIYKIYNQFIPFLTPLFDKDDLVSTLLVSFYRAIQLFDLNRKVKFSTYVVNSMKYAVRQALNSSLSIHIPIRVQKERAKLLKHTEKEGQFANKGGQNVEFDKLNKSARLRLDLLKSLPKVDIFLDENVGSDYDFCYSDIIPDTKNQIEDLERYIDLDFLFSYVGQFLTVRELDIVKRFYFTSNDHKFTGENSFAMISSDLGLSRQRVQDIHNRAIKKMQSSTHRAMLSNLLTGNGRYS